MEGQNDKKRQAFYQRFVTDIINELTNNSVLDKLWQQGILTRSEWDDKIRDLSKEDNRREFWQILTKKDYLCVPELIKILDEVTGYGQKRMVNEMKLHLQDNDPALALQYGFVPLTPTSPLSSPFSLPCDMPNLIHNFVERGAKLHELHEVVMRQPGRSTSAYALLAILCGLGGVGKTMLARRYVDYFKEQNPGSVVFWIKSESRSTLRFSFRRLGKHFGALDGRGTKAIAQSVYTCLRAQPCLFLFDNASEYEGEDGIVDFLPPRFEYLSGQHHQHYILATSRRTDLVNTDRIIPLGVFEEDESHELVFKRLPESSFTSRQKLCTMLGFLPLALQQAIAYIHKRNNAHEDENDAINAYLWEYETNSRKMLKGDVYNEDGRRNEKTVYLTWQTTLSTIEKQTNGNLAVALLRCLAYLNPDNIELGFVSLIDLKFRLLGQLDSKLPGALGRILLKPSGSSERPQVRRTPSAAYQAKMESAAILLSEYSMITLEKRKICVHRLVQEVVRLQTMNDTPDECTFIERIVAHIEISRKTNMEQSILHGTVVFPFYLNYQALKSKYPEFSSNVLRDQQLLELVLSESSSASRTNAAYLIRTLEKDSEAISMALRCVKSMRAREPLGVYVSTCQEIKEGGFDVYMSPRKSVRLFNWINARLDTKDTAAGEILECFPFLDNSFVSARFLGALLPARIGEIRPATQLLQKYGVINVQDGDIVDTEMPDQVERVHSQSMEYLRIVLETLETTVYSQDLGEESFMHTVALIDKFPDAVSAHPRLAEKISTWKELSSFIQENVPRSSPRQVVNLAHRLEYEKEAIDYALRFIGRLYPMDVTDLSMYISACDRIESSREFQRVKKLNRLDRVKYLNWMVTRRSRSRHVELLLDALLLLDETAVNTTFLAELWPDFKRQVTDALRVLSQLGLITIRGREVVGIEIPSLLKKKYYWHPEDFSESLRNIATSICQQLEGQCEHRCQYILHGYHILRFTDADSACQAEVRLLKDKLCHYEPLIDLVLNNVAHATKYESVRLLQELNWSKKALQECVKFLSGGQVVERVIGHYLAVVDFVRRQELSHINPQQLSSVDLVHLANWRMASGNLGLPSTLFRVLESLTEYHIIQHQFLVRFLNEDGARVEEWLEDMEKFNLCLNETKDINFIKFPYSIVPATSGTRRRQPRRSQRVISITPLQD